MTPRRLAHRSRPHAPAGRGLVRRLPRRDGQVQGRGDRAGSRHRRAACRGDQCRRSPRSTVPLVIDADGLTRARPSRRRPRPARQAQRPEHPHSRTTGSTPASPGRRRGRTASPRPAASPRHRSDRAAEGTADRGGHARGRRARRAAGRRRRARPWPRRAAATSSRGSSAPSAPGASSAPAAALGAHVHGRAAAGGPPEGLVAGDLPGLVADELSKAELAPARPPCRWLRRPPCGSSLPEDEDARDHGPGSLAAGLGRDRPGRGGPQRRRPGPPRAARPSCARWSRRTGTGTAVRRWPGPRWPAAPAAGRGVGRRGGRAARARRHRTGAAAQRVRSRRGRDGARLRPHADGLLGRRHRRLCRGRAGGGPSGRGARQGRHGHAPGRRGARDLAAVAAAVVGEPVLGSRASGPTCPWPTASRPRTAPTRTASSTSSSTWWATSAPTASTAPLLHAANTAATVAFPRARMGMVRCGLGLYGYLPGVVGADRLRRAGGRRDPAPGDGAQGPGRRGAHARGRRAPLLRPAAPVARALAWWPPCPSATPTVCPARSSTAGYEVLIGGVRRPLAGMVTMDQIVVDCGADDIGATR